MKNYGLFKTIGLVIVTCLILGCSGEDGEIGPEGPQGEQGEQGLQGEPGNSNVIASEWFGIETWEDDRPFGKLHPILELTNAQLERAVILVYRKDTYSPGFSLINMLPTETVRTRTRINIPVPENQLEIIVESLSNDFEVPSNEYLPPEIQFRYVILEPPSTSGKVPSVDFSKMTYEEVVDYLGLKS
ncbi:collagen-like protein [Flagellimonas flava]|uniref:Collagen triple helix repeat-containing protein n=1 Tax=Flagellimonas flava TaxID=570519 RepID=A0A1M5IP11_9FLAO|nr:collagen-like protein [Allomuricauda flava]SHG30052.1 hypothetical protein SAMN04488116_0839 [Allomuricauda flava]